MYENIEKLAGRLGHTYLENMIGTENKFSANLEFYDVGLKKSLHISGIVFSSQAQFSVPNGLLIAFVNPDASLVADAAMATVSVNTNVIDFSKNRCDFAVILGFDIYGHTAMCGRYKPKKPKS